MTVHVGRVIRQHHNAYLVIGGHIDTEGAGRLDLLDESPDEHITRWLHNAPPMIATPGCFWRMGSFLATL
jgi:hypothetical protein